MGKREQRGDRTAKSRISVGKTHQHVRTFSTRQFGSQYQPWAPPFCPGPFTPVPQPLDISSPGGWALRPSVPHRVPNPLTTTGPCTAPSCILPARTAGNSLGHHI